MLATGGTVGGGGGGGSNIVVGTAWDDDEWDNDMAVDVDEGVVGVGVSGVEGMEPEPKPPAVVGAVNAYIGI